MDALDDLLDDFDQQKQHLPKLSPATIFQQEKALADFKQFLGVMQDRAKEKGRDWLAELPGAPKELGAVIEEGGCMLHATSSRRPQLRSNLNRAIRCSCDECQRPADIRKVQGAGLDGKIDRKRETDG